MDAWRMEYNTVRPHQAPKMDTPAERLTPVLDKQRAVLAAVAAARTDRRRLWPGPASAEPIDDELYEESLTVTAAQSVLARWSTLKPFPWG